MSEVILYPPEELKPYARNARRHSGKQIQKIADSIQEFGFNNPILVDTEKTIIAGHGRWEAAKKLALESVPTLCLSHLSPEEVRAYILADNKLAEMAGWDAEILAIELQDLLSINLTFDIEITGFETGEIDFLIDGPVQTTLDPADEAIMPDKESPAQTQPGDLWQLGKHRLYCGNSLEDGSYKALMQGEQAQMVFTDPPYAERRVLRLKFS